MPKLPSGKQIGIDGTGVNRLLDEIRRGTSAETEMRTWADVMRYVRIVEFVPPDVAGEKHLKLPLDERSARGSEGLVPVDTGYTLTQVREATADWSEDDKVAFAGFLGEPRIEAYLGEVVAAVAKAMRVADEHRIRKEDTEAEATKRMVKNPAPYSQVDKPTLTEEQIQAKLQRMRDQGYGTVEISFAEEALRGLVEKPQGNA